jgi:UDP-glucose 4-epimerase
MNVLVTGGAGFIGSHLVDKLLDLNFNVSIIDNLSTGHIKNIHHFKNKVDFINADLSTNKMWPDKLKNIDTVFHLAALADIVPSIENPKEYFNSNVIGTLHLLEACKKQNVKNIIYSASSSCYGLPDKIPTPENAEIKPQYPYALTKRLGEELVLHWSNVYGINATSLRFFNVYGTRSRTSGTYGAVFGVFLAQKLAGVPYTVVGDGLQTRDFTYVSDIVDALILASKNKNSGQIFNVGSGKTISVKKITELLGGNVVYIPKRPGEPQSTFADITKIKTELNFKPNIPIEEGIKLILNDINYWKDAPVWTPKKIDVATKSWFKYLS